MEKTDRCVTGTYLFYCLVLHLIYKFNFHSVAYSCAANRNDLWRNIADIPWKDYSAWNKTKSFSIATWSITVNIRKHCVYFRPSDRVQEKKWKLCGKKCRLCGELCGIAHNLWQSKYSISSVLTRPNSEEILYKWKMRLNLFLWH